MLPQAQSTLGSPLQIQFDFELDFAPPSFSGDVASEIKDGVNEGGEASEGRGMGRERDERGRGDGTTAAIAGRGLSNAGLGTDSQADDLDDFARAIELSLSRPGTSGSQTGASAPPQFHPSLFPHKAVSDPATMSPIMSPMSRSFIDSRDKPYGPSPTPRPPMMMANHSSPSLSRPDSSGDGLRNTTMPYHPRLSPRIAMHEQSAGTNYSGSTARPSTRASSISNSLTIGTPYQATSSAFPLPQHVQTRPNNDNTEAMVAGVKVPTHHTSSAPKAATKSAAKPASKQTTKPASKPASKPAESKRKTRLINPLNLLQRRKSEYPIDQGDEERAQRQAQAQALARQRDVVASGVNKPPPGFDPRIKGKKVHDFSAPRGKRNTFDEMDLPLPPPGLRSSTSPSLDWPMSPMSGNAFPPRTASLVNRGLRQGGSETPERRSTHTPVFVEHLGEDPEAERRVSSIDAENLENKAFLQRVSKQSAVTTTSQESHILPPFARRSQTLDPLQASLYQDDESRRSSDPSTTDKDHDTSLSSLGDISPITARSSAQNFGAVSPSGGEKSSRPVSNMAPTEHITRPARTSSTGQPRRDPAEVTTNNYWVVLAPPTVETIAEGPADSSPIEPPATPQSSSQGPHLASQGISIRRPGSKSQSPTGRANSPATPSHTEKMSATPTPDTTPDSRSPATSRKLVEKRASAVGHAKRASGTPKKHASNASRFSFQLGESTAQEQALEEKHRKIVSNSGPSKQATHATSPDEDEDEDDYFDEDAMDDMDEMEMQSEQSADHQPTVPQSSLYLHQARQALHGPESDDGSAYDEDEPEVTDERDVPYADHPAFRAHPAMAHQFAHNSMLPVGNEDYDGCWRDSTLDSYMRESYYSSPQSEHSRMQSRGSRTTVDTSSPLIQGSGAPSFQDYLSANDGIKGTNHMSTPRSNIQVSATSSPIKTVRPPLPARDSGNSERNRVASGMMFNPNLPTPSSEKSPWVGEATQSSDHHVRDMSFSTISEAQSLNSPGGAPNSRPVTLNLNTRGPSQHDDHVTSPKLDKVTLAGLENGQVNARSKPPPLTSPKSAKSFRSDGRRNGSVGGLSLNSPRSLSSHDSAGSESFETFAESSGFSRVTSPQAGRSNGGDALLRASDKGQQYQRVSGAGEQVEATHPNNGLGLDTFSGFDFGQQNPPLATTPNNSRSPVTNTSDPHKKGHKARFSLFPHQTNSGSRPDSRGLQKDATPLQFTMPQSNRTTASHYSGLSDASHSTAAAGSMASYSPVRSSAMPDFHFPRASGMHDDESKDDMYFDDGNFEQDINVPHPTAFDENTFDDDAFLARPGMNVGGRRELSNGVVSTTSVGPYPTFAMPNAVKARQRESQLMLEDLILQEPVDPKLIPQRNPSEDAKRSGLSDRAPPLAVEPSNSEEEAMHMQRTLDNYHAALANAANRAAADGRFWREPSSASQSIRSKNEDGKSTYSWDEKSVSSNVEEDDEGPPCNAVAEANELKSLPRASGMAFDFGFGESTMDDVNDYDYDNDDDLVAAANAEALASDDEGFYGQEFAFYGRPRANSNEFNPTIGGYFGEDGDDGLTRNKSLREPNLTPITERSEFSTRNSMIGLGLGMPLYGPPSAGLYGSQSPALARMSVTPLMESEMSFEELRRLRGQAFGGSSRSLQSNSARSSAQSLEGSLVQGNRPGLSNPQQNSGAGTGTSFTFPSRTQSSDSSNPSSVQAPVSGQALHESPQSATSSQGNPFSMDVDLTPRKNSQPVVDHSTAKKLPRESITSQSEGQTSHSRQGSNADSVTYVREPDPDNSGKPRWVMERRRTSEQGQLQLIGRELVQGGWI
ncbi:uncharacterized protein RCC_06587 [Ramularia collo-cygni]|uniref:Uncharacterized protein n=1 Tax=Ramularia collo-cygni TaxID=112498 RepID=A0A2D3VFU5_9PEZI|nr:uncharacterized protein RCC_06587 [Ramularia collo-cygni]CZT20729.1 uncharacterized protein RCC_06587 [Ramularia collo-cygni]